MIAYRVGHLCQYVAFGLNIAAFNVGIALGSIIGGQTVQNFGLAQTPWIGAVIVVLALLLIGISTTSVTLACSSQTIFQL